MQEKIRCGFLESQMTGLAQNEHSDLTKVCIECIGQSAPFVCSNRTLRCPPGSYKRHRLSAPIYTALFVQVPKPQFADDPGVGEVEC